MTSAGSPPLIVMRGCYGNGKTIYMHAHKHKASDSHDNTAITNQHWKYPHFCVGKSSCSKIFKKRSRNRKFHSNPHISIFYPLHQVSIYVKAESPIVQVGRLEQ